MSPSPCHQAPMHCKFICILTMAEGGAVDLSYFNSTRGAKILCYKGYSYTLERVLVSEKKVWRCQDRSCKGRMHVLPDNSTVKEVKDHSHAPDPIAIEVRYTPHI